MNHFHTCRILTKFLDLIWQWIVLEFVQEQGQPFIKAEKAKSRPVFERKKTDFVMYLYFEKYAGDILFENSASLEWRWAKKRRRHFCDQFWKNLQINWDGCFSDFFCGVIFYHDTKNNCCTWVYKRHKRLVKLTLNSFFPGLYFQTLFWDENLLSNFLSLCPGDAYGVKICVN